MKISLMEELSLLMDGEQTEHSQEALIELLLENQEARALWSRYHLIRGSFKNTLKPGESMVSRVRAEIDKEPAPWELSVKDALKE